MLVEDRMAASAFCRDASIFIGDSMLDVNVDYARVEVLMVAIVSIRMALHKIRFHGYDFSNVVDVFITTFSQTYLV